jgi:hypothetical protein
MKLAWTAVALGALCFTKSAVAQTQPPKVLLQILHCAETDKFGLLPRTTKKDDKLAIAWSHKVRYEPYVDEFFIVRYTSATQGAILVYSRQYAKGEAHFSLINNAGFVVESGNLQLIDPLYGLWTRANIARNVKRAMRGRRYSIPMGTLVGPFRNVGCHSYSDSE